METKEENQENQEIQEIQEIQEKYLTNINLFDENPWKPPSRHGLRNSEPIIPSYYCTNNIIKNNQESKIINIDYITIVKDDIRNYRKLNTYQIDYIKNVVDDEIKNEIIDILLQVNNTIIDISIAS